MNELKRTLRDVDANLRRLNQELRSATRHFSESRKFRLREPQRTTARILVAMHHGEPTAAMGYILSKRKGKGLDHTSVTQAESELRGWWRRADDATKRSHLVTGEASIKMQNAFRQAQRFTVEVDLEGWVEDQKVHKGINPAPGLVLRHASMLKASKGVGAASTCRGERRWLQRWRSRRVLQLRKFPVQERLSVDHMQLKFDHQADGYEYTCSRIAAALTRGPGKNGDHFLVQFLVPFYWRGTEKGARKRSSFFTNSPKVLLKSVLLMRPEIAASWRWSNYLQSRGAPGRPQVLINLDETNVKLVPQEREGSCEQECLPPSARPHF